MLLSECLEKSVSILQQEGIPFALAGGLAASVYRNEVRVTADVDFVIDSDGDPVSKGKKS